MADIGHFEWKGKHGEFSKSFFHNDKVLAKAAGGLEALLAPLWVQCRALAGVQGVEPPEALKIVPFLRVLTDLECSMS